MNIGFVFAVTSENSNYSKTDSKLKIKIPGYAKLAYVTIMFFFFNQSLTHRTFHKGTNPRQRTKDRSLPSYLSNRKTFVKMSRNDL